MNKNEIDRKNSSIVNNARFALSTIDNPYNPFTQFTDWLMFDNDKGYQSCAYLARIANCSDQMSDEENNEEIERAIDEIIKYDFRGIFTKVKNDDYQGFKS